MTTERDEVVVTILTSNSSRDELVEALDIMNREAKREQCIVGSEAHPSRWDAAHGHIDSLLDELAGR